MRLWNEMMTSEANLYDGVSAQSEDDDETEDVEVSKRGLRPSHRRLSLSPHRPGRKAAVGGTPPIHLKAEACHSKCLQAG